MINEAFLIKKNPIALAQEKSLLPFRKKLITSKINLCTTTRFHDFLFCTKQI